MAVRIKFLGHSGFELTIDGHKLLIDPWLTSNPVATMAAGDLEAQLILLSHAHDDHVADAADIAKRSGATIVCNFEMGNWYLAQGLEHVFQGNPGGSFRNDWLSAKWTVAHHSSSFGDGSYGGQPNGFVMRGGGQTIYHAGDTSLFGDMALIGGEGLDVALIPIGDVFTMGVADSIKAIQLLRPATVIPMHYNTFPPIEQDAAAWARRVESETDAQPAILLPGEVLDLD